MTDYRHDLPERPRRVVKLPLDRRGYPVPYFVTWIDGEPDFRVVDSQKYRQCLSRRLCWICGEPLGRNLAFVIGPMCAVNRTTSEPAQHLECAEYAVRACPFMMRPAAVRRDAGLPAKKPAPGFLIERNPGVSLIWVTRSFKLFKAEHGHEGTLIELGPPALLLWYAEGRAATRREIEHSFDTGIPPLLEMAQRGGLEAVADLRSAILEAVKLFPADVPV